MQVIVYWKDDKNADWLSGRLHFHHLIQVGERFAFDPESDWYEVVAVVHLPTEHEQIAEIYAKKLDRAKLLKAVFPIAGSVRMA